jgi:hypothetical protein
MTATNRLHHEPWRHGPPEELIMMIAPDLSTSSHYARQRAWLSPLTGITFVVVGLSGVLMLLHLRLPGMTMLHELSGLLFVIVGVWHLKLNWRALMAHCGQGRGRVALVVGAVLIVLFLALGIGHDSEHDQRGQHGSRGLRGAGQIVQ